jgi:small subunit ribosomal protein S20
MANHASAEKRDRQRVARTTRNRSVKSEVRTELKKARTAIEGAGATAAAVAPLVAAASQSLDRAAAKGIVHKKAASRRKSRLAKAANKLAAK